ncbi:hypothetical protein JCM6882_000810 [Rhodosporidiobolus microsporus]
MSESAETGSEVSTGGDTLPVPLPDVTRFVQAPPPHRMSLRRTTARFLREEGGRDASLRLLQYTLRLTVCLRKKALPSSISVRLLAIVSTLAAIRRLAALSTLLASFRSNLLPPSVDNPRAHFTQRINLSVDLLLSLLRSTFDLVAVLADNAYLFSRLRLLPLSARTTLRIDKVSDVAAVLSASVGLAQVIRRRRGVFTEGRAARRRAVAAEKRLEELEFWEGINAGRSKREREKGRKKSLEEVAREEEERDLRETVKRERRKMKNLHEVLSELRWERVKVVAEGVFALYDALDLETAAEGVKATSGIVSAGIEFSQAWAAYVASHAQRKLS